MMGSPLGLRNLHVLHWFVASFVTKARAAATVAHVQAARSCMRVALHETPRSAGRTYRAVCVCVCA